MPLAPTRRAFGTMALAGLAAAALPATRARAATALNFQSIWLNDPEFAGYFIAIDKGYYKDEGLAVNYMSGGPDVIPQAALLTGKADIALTSTIETAEAIFNKGAKFVVIGSQFQKSPDSIISMASSNIKTAKDLAGKTVACPPLSLVPFKVLLSLNGVDASTVKIVPYSYDPTPLASGQVDAVIDFMTSLPFLIEQTTGKKASYMLFYDLGMPFGQDLVTVTQDMLKTHRKEIVAFLRASRKGWTDAFADPDKYVAEFDQTYFKGNGGTPEAEKYQSHVQIPLMQTPKGVYLIDDATIAQNVDSLNKIGIKATKEMFDPSVFAEAAG